MKFKFFLDETGDHGLSYIDPNFPLFLLCGCLLREDELLKLESEINAFKMKYFKTTEVILHSRDIRKCDGAFQILFDLDLKARFYEDMNKIVKDSAYNIIGAGIKKEEHIKKYGKEAKDPYALSLSFVIERLVFCLDKFDKNSSVDVKVEKRGRKEDALLLSHFHSIMDRGTYFVSRERLRERITSFEFIGKRENIVGLQLADLNAYPLARHLLNPKEPYVPFSIIENKIYCDGKGEYDGWGLKLFP